MSGPPDVLAAVTARLTAAPKYRGVHPDTIAQVVAQEGAGVSSPAEVERRARARLHKVAALHLLTARPAALRREVAGLSESDLRAGCRALLARHVSTAERLADLDEFYPAVLELVPPPRTIADVACALNVFTVPWLREVTDARYVGYDFNADFVEVGNAFLAARFPDCHVVHHDVLARGAPPAADLVLLLKTYHCMEDRSRGAALRLVEDLAAGHVVVSFPTRAMNGRAAVFARRHVEDLTALAERRGWSLARRTLRTEDLVVLGKNQGEVHCGGPGRT